MISQRKDIDAVRQPAYRFGICVFLIIATAAIYWPVRNFDFLNFDDNLYVEVLGKLERGFTFNSVFWSFRHATDVTIHWLPITWLSLLVDHHFYGLEAGGYHTTNVLIHICNSVLLFLVLSRITGASRKSAFVAMLFALHPLHVESVAWVTERKDVLSALFWLLTMWGYTRYVQSISVGRYLLTLFFFALGLMSKPMIVTLPFVLLLLDYWPLRRTDKANWVKLVVEKLPFLALAVVAGIAAYTSQYQAGSTSSLDTVSIPVRISVALISYVQYLIKMFWPVNLAALYPYPAMVPAWQTIGAALCLIGVTCLVIRFRRHPYFLMGWLWYIGTLIPVIGLIVHGPHGMADRYTYIPLIGVFIAFTWGITSFLDNYRHRHLLLSAGALLILILLTAITRTQIGYWQNSATLFTHALEVTENNYTAHNNLGSALLYLDLPNEATEEFRKALRIKPDFIEARLNLGMSLAILGRTDEAISELAKTVRMDPDYARAHNVLAKVYLTLDQENEAIREFKEVLRINPDAEAHYYLGIIFINLGQMNDAIRNFKEALLINPHYIEAREKLRQAEETSGKKFPF